MQNDIVQQTVDEALGMLGLQNTSMQDKTQEQNKNLDVATASELLKEDAELKPFTLIQCFYGVDEQRISATITALNYMLQLDPKPDEWIFIEAQKSKDLCKFSWLKHNGIKYKFIKINKQNEFIPLKSALWNIGADIAKNDLFAFVDADCYFLNLDWANAVKIALNNYDFCSLSQFNIYNEKPSNQLETVGSRWLKIKDKKEKFQFGHCGFTLGTNRTAFDAIGKIETLPALEDIHLWTKVFQFASIYSKDGFFVAKHMRNQLTMQFNVGAADGTCVHVFHRTYSKTNYTDILKTADMLGGGFPGIDTSKTLPVWTRTSVAEKMKYAFQQIYEKSKIQALSLADDMCKSANNENTHADICYITDDNYVQHTLVSIASLVTNKYATSDYRIFVVCDNVADSKKQLFRAFDKQNVKIELVEYNNNEFTKKKQELGKYISSATYIRLKLPTIFPDVNKLLYLDGDTIVQDDLCELYNIDLEDAAIAGTPDVGICIDSLKSPMTDYVRKTLPCYEKEYFNAGVLLLNLDKLRKINFEKCAEKLYNERTDFIFADQDILNFGLFKRKKLFSIYWNCPVFSLLFNYGQHSAEFLKDRIQHIYDTTYEKDLMELIYKAKILHMNGDKSCICDIAYLDVLYDKYYRIALKTYQKHKTQKDNT